MGKKLLVFVWSKIFGFCIDCYLWEITSVELCQGLTINEHSKDFSSLRL